MKILTYTDCHFSQYSSIVRSRSNKFSVRLENIIKSVNWAESLAVEQQADIIVINGDFFDKADLNAEEITAFEEIKWAHVPHYVLVGNHEMGINDLSYSSAHLLKSIPMCTLITTPCYIHESMNSQKRLLFLPYMLESNRKDFSYYAKHASPIYSDDIYPYEKTIVFSHNDISGIRYGQYESKIGFNVKEITENCDLYINGHLHNQEQINDKILNLGNLTGQNFSEDATKYAHCAGIIDTNTLSIDLIENPYAFNFYKFEIKSMEDLKAIEQCKENSVVALKACEGLVNTVKETLLNCDNIIEYRITTIPDITVQKADIHELTKLDHIDQFKNFIINQLGQSDILNEELARLH